jgi:hypothetical protein
VPGRFVTSFAFLAGAMLSLGSFARAAPFQFTLEGNVDFTLIPEVAVGDTARIRFTVDNEDLEPSPTFGKYLSSGTVTIDFPQTTLIAGQLGYLQVKLFFADRISYLNTGQSLSFDMPLSFPDGTIPTDELPSAIPLSLATVNKFYIFPISNEIISGRITSYSAAPIPETGSTFGGATYWLLMRAARRRKRRGCCQSRPMS